LKRILLLLSALLIIALHATDLPVKLIKPDTLYIGESFTLEIEIPKDEKVNISEPKNINSDQVVLIKTELQDSDKTYKYLLTVAAFDTGKVDVPAISFYKKSEKTLDSLLTQSFSIWVSSSLTPADTTIKDIKEPESVYLEWQDYVLLLIIFNLLSLLYVLVKNFRNRKNKEEEYQTIDLRPAWEKAMEMLIKLKEQDLLEKNEWIEYHYSLSIVLRHFLMLQFNVKAVEMTTYEVKESLPTDFQFKREIIQLLSFCDQIKYAKGIPDISISKKYEEWLEQYIISFKIESKETEAL